MTTTHTPVLLAETLEYLNVRPGGTYLDATVGGGGHTEAILLVSAPDGIVVGLDRDPEAVIRVRARLGEANERLRLRHESYAYADVVARELSIPSFDGILLDLGLSSDQLQDQERGFSFQTEGRLDLRFDPTKGQTAADLVNSVSETTLSQILARYGELHAPRRLAHRIVTFRRSFPIRTTTDLVAASGLKDPRRRAQLFQALRIAVNDELETLARSLPRLWNLLAPGGRLVVISFHSLEDRIVKQFFQDCATAQVGIILTKKPVRATEAERNANPRSRSAKLRAIERIV